MAHSCVELMCSMTGAGQSLKVDEHKTPKPNLLLVIPRTWVRDGDCVLSACVKGVWWGSDFMISAAGLF